MPPEAAKQEQGKRRAGGWRRMGLMSLSVLLTAAVLEILLRLGIGGRPLRFNDALSAADRSPVYYRASGERLHPWSWDCPDPLRIAVIGDSFTVGAGVQPDDTYAARLERMLNANNGTRPAEVEIFGACGTSTSGQLRFLKQALDWKPRVVVLGICLNDTEDWASAPELVQWRADMAPRKPPAFCAGLSRHVRLFDLVYDRSQHARMHRGYIRYYQRLYDPAYTGWGKFAQAIELFHNDCRNEGVKVVVLIFPLLSEPFDQGRYPFEFVHQAIRRLLDGKDIPYVDLLEALRGKLPVRMQAIPHLDPHPSEIVHRIAAETLLNYMLAEGYIEAAYKVWETGASPHRIWKRTAEHMDGAEPAASPAAEPPAGATPPP